MNGLSSGCVPINPGHENKSASLFAGGKVAFAFEDRHERENRGVGILSVEGVNHVRDRRLALGPDDLHDAVFRVAERQSLLSWHGPVLSIKDLVIGKIASA